MRRVDEVTCSDCGETLEPDDLVYMPVTREVNLIVCEHCESTVGVF